jgi:chromosome segregation ATPase
MSTKPTGSEACVHEADWGTHREQIANLKSAISDMRTAYSEMQTSLQQRIIALALLDRAVNSLNETLASVSTNTTQQLTVIQKTIQEHLTQTDVRVAELTERYRTEVSDIISESLKVILASYPTKPEVTEVVTKHVNEVELAYKKKANLVIFTTISVVSIILVVTKVVPFSAIIGFFTP